MESIEQKMISMVDIKGIEEFIKSRRSFDEIDVYQYVKEWARNKKHIFELFGEKLSIEKEVELDLSKNHSYAKEEIDKFIDKIRERGYEYIKAYLFVSSLSVPEFYFNVINVDRNILGMEFKKGDKVSRILGKIMKNLDKKESSKVITEYSMFLQSLKAKGKVVLSIDPLDYVTMSENKSNWSSCHSLTGCYQTGPFSYMMDSTTAISYAKPSKDIELDYDGGTLVYSNKIWRQIVLFSSNLEYATQARQYPAIMRANQQTVASIVSDLLKSKNEIPYQTISWEPDYDSYSTKVHFSWSSGYCYNDIQEDAFSTAYSIIPSKVENTPHNIECWFEDAYNEEEICKVGSEVMCISGCGCLCVDNEELLCSDCY